MEPEQLPDWRIYFAAQVAKIEGHDPMGAKPGDLIVTITETKTSEDGLVAFPVVSPYRLALSIAIRASSDAKRLRKEVRFNQPPRGMKAKTIDFMTVTPLYDYFEQCMIAATFSYQALETYANHIIEQTLSNGRTMTLQRRKGPESYNAEALQREVSTEDKIATVLPDLLSLPLNKSSKLWQEFTILRRVRDAIIHLKSKDHYVGGSVDRETVFYRLLNNHPPRYPRATLHLMRHFSGGAELTWLDHAEERLKKA